jgi:parallel beta-helix repeat protein
LVHGIFLEDISYVTFDRLHITRARVNIYVTGRDLGSHGITIRNCRISDAYFHGIQGWDQSLPNNDVTIHNNRIVKCGGAGINWTKFGDGGVISHNTVRDNGQLTDEETGSGEHAFTAAISLFGNLIGIENIVIEHNVVSGHAAAAAPVNSGGVGIWVDQTLGGNIVRYNVVHGNASNGIVAEDTPGGGMIYYNVVYDNGYGTSFDDGFGINLMRDSWGWEVYNNTVFDNGIGIVLADWIGDGVPNNVVVKNNIIYGSSTRELMALHGAQDLENLFQYNFIEEKPGFVRWGNDYFDTIAQWRAVAGDRVADNLSGDPRFVDASRQFFRLTWQSPCLNAGTDVGLTEDISGAEVSIPPSMGAFENPLPRPQPTDPVVVAPD